MIVIYQESLPGDRQHLPWTSKDAAAMSLVIQYAHWGDIISTVGDIVSTLGGVQYTRGYHEYIGGIS